MKKTRFTFNSITHVLAEEIHPDNLVMYFETNKEICPHCKEEIVKGEHHNIVLVEFWIPENRTSEQCSLKDLVAVGKSDSVSLLLNKEVLLQALEYSILFKGLRGV